MQWSGKVLSIYVRSKPSGPVIEMGEVRAVPGKGIEGDHYFFGSSPERSGADRELTLIESETISAIEEENQITLDPGESRRNIITENVPLNHLVGKEFRVGEVTLKGIRLCEPCSHLRDLTQKEIIKPLVHRGGLRAQIISEGIIQSGDEVSLVRNTP